MREPNKQILTPDLHTAENRHQAQVHTNQKAELHIVHLVLDQVAVRNLGQRHAHTLPLQAIHRIEVHHIVHLEAPVAVDPHQADPALTREAHLDHQVEVQVEVLGAVEVEHHQEVLVADITINIKTFNYEKDYILCI